MWLLWLQDKLRPVELSVKGWPKKCEVIANGEQRDGLKYSRFHRLSSTNCQPHFQPFPAAYSPLSRSNSAGESADFPRLFRIFCTCRCATSFPQSLRSEFAGFDVLSRKEKGRKRSAIRGAAENGSRFSVLGCQFRFSADARNYPMLPRHQIRRHRLRAVERRCPRLRVPASVSEPHS